MAANDGGPYRRHARPAPESRAANRHMIVETENDATRQIASEDVLEAFEDDPRPVEFNDEGRARVPAEVGEFLAETREGVSIAKDERETENEDH